ncbi:diadenylate cyclase [Nodularia spumigena]|uniref:diadenylate cyclase n=1 Tax=Nodularia spumigena TaxID=70799 RepID=UPI002B21A307|nr:diadenylate cyclase [Nodularia spumigena]MEA5557684.1 diadenylate cyclase [Nodularia spumigena CH309]
MIPFERLSDLVDRLSTYTWWEVLLELTFIWIFVYAVARFVQGTRAAGALKGVLVLFLLLTLGAKILAGSDAFPRIGFLFDKVLGVIALGLIVIFQPELRRAVMKLGETSIFRGTPTEIAAVAQEISDAAAYLSKARFGAIMVLQRQEGAKAIIDAGGGTIMNADLSARLLQTIFFPGSALHDLAVLVRGKTLVAAGVQLPLADPSEMPDPSLGSRHRAAVGVSKEQDVVVVVVSEETGAVRLAERGRLSQPMTPVALRVELAKRLGKGTIALAPAESTDDPESTIRDAAPPARDKREIA